MNPRTAWWVSAGASVLLLIAALIAMFMREWEAAAFFSLLAVGFTLLRLRSNDR